jgi:hypothetical protein
LATDSEQRHVDRRVVAQSGEALRQSLSQIGRIASGESCLKSTLPEVVSGKADITVAPVFRRRVIGELRSEHRIGRLSRKFLRRWLMPIAERMLAALACRNFYRNLHVSCHLDQPSRRVVARFRAGFVART